MSPDGLLTRTMRKTFGEGSIPSTPAVVRKIIDLLLAIGLQNL